MADDWKPGDLALCVRPELLASAGGVYTVAEVFWDCGSTDTTAGWGLIFSDLPATGNFDGYDAERFRKINPLTDEEREEALRDLKLPERVS